VRRLRRHSQAVNRDGSHGAAGKTIQKASLHCGQVKVFRNDDEHIFQRGGAAIHQLNRHSEDIRKVDQMALLKFLNVAREHVSQIHGLFRSFKMFGMQSFRPQACLPHGSYRAQDGSREAGSNRERRQVTGRLLGHLCRYGIDDDERSRGGDQRQPLRNHLGTGQIQSHALEGFHPSVHHRSAGKGNSVQPLMSDPQRRRENPLLLERSVSADLREFPTESVHNVPSPILFLEQRLQPRETRNIAKP